jgi:tRNA threonylcarbamoyl adenosine modification protein (Sua5/YciO/YrdC/YwlC family)
VFLSIDPAVPQPWLVARVAEVLRRGGVAVLPTDTVYGIACSVAQPEAIKRIYALKGLDPRKPLSLLLPDVGEVARWARAVTTPAYRLMKRVLPGPYTFILPASSEVPRIMLRTRKTVGIRVPDNPIVRAVLRELGSPLLTTSVRTDDDEFVNDPFALEERLGGVVDVVVDGGPLLEEPSTVVDLSGREPVLVRAGKGEVGALQLFGD